MKKILFIAIAFIGFSKMATAQEGARVGVTPVPTKAQVAKDVNTKMQSQPAQQSPQQMKMEKEKQARWIDPNTENYKRAGLTDPQIATISSAMKNLELKKSAIQSNSSLNNDQKTTALSAIEAEKQSVLQKNMEPATYKKFTQVSQPEQKLSPLKN